MNRNDLRNPYPFHRTGEVQAAPAVNLDDVRRMVAARRRANRARRLSVLGCFAAVGSLALRAFGGAA